MSVLPRGYRCECGKVHRFPMYVYAHWNERITHTCDRCQRRYAIQRGVARRVGKPPIPRHIPSSRWEPVKGALGLVYRGKALKITWDEERSCYAGFIGRQRVFDSDQTAHPVSQRAKVAYTLQGLVDQMLSGRVDDRSRQ